jgi:hypothetical protein
MDKALQQATSKASSDNADALAFGADKDDSECLLFSFQNICAENFLFYFSRAFLVVCLFVLFCAHNNRFVIELQWMSAVLLFVVV